MTQMSNAKPRTKQSRLARDKKTLRTVYNVRKGVKRSASFAFGLFINVLIVYAIVKMFSYSFHFGYGLFGKVAKSPGSNQYVVVNIPPDSSAYQIGDALQKAEIIEDKFIFWAKIKIKKLGGKLTSGEFHLSASMTYDEIIDVLCPPEEDEATDSNGKKKQNNDVVDTGTVDLADLTTEATTEEGETTEAGEEGETGGDENGGDENTDDGEGNAEW